MSKSADLKHVNYCLLIVKFCLENNQWVSSEFVRREGSTGAAEAKDPILLSCSEN